MNPDETILVKSAFQIYNRKGRCDGIPCSDCPISHRNDDWWPGHTCSGNNEICVEEALRYLIHMGAVE